MYSISHMGYSYYAQPTLLNLYDTHYLPLQEGLRPVMKAFILALLPGLEEETGEFFEKVSSDHIKPHFPFVPDKAAEIGSGASRPT